MKEQDNLVLPSRDGDQFHYHWAARRCLAMLAPSTDLKAVTIEGVPLTEGKSVSQGLDAIDVAEYYGDVTLEDATTVHYVQLKHSTRHGTAPWTVSGIAKTLKNFGKRYQALTAKFGVPNTETRFTFEFLSNRPIAASLTAALELLRSGVVDTKSKALAAATTLPAPLLQGFASCLTLTGNTEGYLEQRSLLGTETDAYLPDRDRDAPLRLKELVTRRATSEYEGRPEITRHHVLEALDAKERDLFPAQLKIEFPALTIERSQMPAIVRTILAGSGPSIVTADGGVGKSVLATRIGPLLPSGSETVIYDCFGNATYRSASGFRHRPRDGFVQIANEMATRGLCDPLIPGRGDATAYTVAFLARLQQASIVLARRSEHAVLAIIIDAADNAEMVARENLDGQSFPRLILREQMPANVRIVLTARPHRVHFLAPPPGIQPLELLPFSEAETAQHLRGRYPEATDLDVREFHRLTSHNPRVQTTAMRDGGTLRATLARLGPTPLTVDDTIELLLNEAVEKIRFDAGDLDRANIDVALTALATLRPFVPLEIIARCADVPVELIRSLVHDLDRPLLIREDAVQFRDEPSETWFQRTFRPSSGALGAFIDRLLPLASTSAYVSATLPQLMLEAGQFDTLVAMALKDDGLPRDDALASRDIQLQRLQFAIKAALRIGRQSDAAALAVKAGRETAADARQQTMLSANSDLAGLFLEPNQMLEQVSRRLIRGGEWTGSDAAYEAAFLSSASNLKGDARSHLRIADDWLGHWATSRGEKRRSVSPDDVAQMAFADINLHGPAACAANLRRWRRREMSYAAGRKLGSRLVDASRFADIDELAVQAGNDLGLLLALVVELDKVGRCLPKGPLKRALGIALRPGVKIRQCHQTEGEIDLIRTVTALVRQAGRARLAKRDRLARLVARYLPTRRAIFCFDRHGSWKGERIETLKAYALLAGLRGRMVTAQTLIIAGSTGDKQARKNLGSRDYEAEQCVNLLVPWAQLWAKAQINRGVADKASLAALAGATDYRLDHDRTRAIDDIVGLWSDILDTPDATVQDWTELEAWIQAREAPLYIPTSTMLARRAARRGFVAVALRFAEQAARLATSKRDDAESQIDSCVEIARATLAASHDEAAAYFDQAVTLSSHVGEENVPSWEVVIHLGHAVTAEPCEDPELAYRFARAAEFTYAHCVRDKHFDWVANVELLASLSPRCAPVQFSRWLDRRFGDEARHLPDLVERLIALEALTPGEALALLAFNGSWNPVALLKAFLRAEHDATLRASSVAMVLRNLRLCGTTPGRWENMVDLLEANGFDAREARIGLAEARRDAPIVHRKQNRPRKTKPDKRLKAYSAILGRLDVTVSAELATGVEKMKAIGPPFEWVVFYSLAAGQVAPGQEARYLEALGTVVRPGAFSMRDVLDAVPSEWLSRAAVPGALARLFRSMVAKDSRFVSAEEQYIPWSQIKAACGLSQRDFAREAVTAFAKQEQMLKGDDFFRLASLISFNLSPTEARTALKRVLSLYDLLLETDDGDGDFNSSLLPPEQLRSTWAGYIWAALGAPHAHRRWSSAHAIRALAQLGENDLLEDLLVLASQGTGDAFVDPRLRFYEMHARLWLTIALARAAAESPIAIAPHRAWFDALATPSEPHLVLRHFAAVGLRALAKHGAISSTLAEHAQWEAMVTGTLAPDTAAPDYPDLAQDEQFIFGHEVQRGDLSMLASALGLSTDAVAHVMRGIIRHDWALADRGHWAEDQRAQRDLYPETAHRHDFDSEVSDLNGYLSSHALICAAGRLLGSSKEAGLLDIDQFDQWMSSQVLTHSDGTWRSDRRDPTPSDLEPLPAIKDKDWPASGSQADTLAHLLPEPGLIAVAGALTRYHADRRERVELTSALVSPGSARSLARTLSAATDRWVGRLGYITTMGVDRPGFQAISWLTRKYEPLGLDKRDPWAAQLDNHWHAPSETFRTSLLLDSDDSNRCWRDKNGSIAFFCDRWSEGIDSDMMHYGGGERLRARATTLDALVSQSGMSLLVEVWMERDLVDLGYGGSRKDVVDGRPVRQIYLYEAGSGWWRPGSASPTRRKTRSPARQ